MTLEKTDSALNQLKDQDPTRIELMDIAVVLIKAATIGLIGDGVKYITTEKLQARLEDQADRLGTKRPAWPIIVDAVRSRMGWKFETLESGDGNLYSLLERNLRLPERRDIFEDNKSEFTRTPEQLADSIREKLFELRILGQITNLNLVNTDTITTSMAGDGTWVDLGTHTIDPGTLGPAGPIFKILEVTVLVAAFELKGFGTIASIQLHYKYEHFCGSNGHRVRFDNEYKTWNQTN